MVNAIRKLAINCSVLLWLATAAFAQDQTDLERRLRELERRMRQIDPTFNQSQPTATLAERLTALERKMDLLAADRQRPVQDATPAPVPAPPAPVLAATQPPVEAFVMPSTGISPQEARGPVTGYRESREEEERLPVAGYMDFHFNKPKGEPGQLDFHRFVLLFGHSFSDRIKFWSELEIEHALVEGGDEKGELELEQAYLDFLIKPWFNLRAGMLLAPVGIINERHEPPSFNGVERPMVETVIIPSTWFDTGFGFTGDLGKGFRYRAYMMGGLDATAFDAEEGFRNGRQKGFQSSFRNPAKVARLEYSGLRKLTLGLSGYTGHTGFNLPGINPRVDLIDFDGRYSYRRFDFRGLFAHANISRTRELNRALQSDFGFMPNIARQMRGWYAEPAVHVLPRWKRQDLVLFTRYERFNTQHRMAEGFSALPQFNRSAWVMGATFKPNADVAFKFDYIVNRNRSSVVPAVNTFNIGLGWWF
jgi:hypothetical protein